MVYRPNTKPSADASNGPLLRSEMKEVDVPATFALEYLTDILGEKENKTVS